MYNNVILALVLQYRKHASLMYCNIESWVLFWAIWFIVHWTASSQALHKRTPSDVPPSSSTTLRIPALQLQYSTWGNSNNVNHHVIRKTMRMVKRRQNLLHAILFFNYKILLPLYWITCHKFIQIRMYLKRISSVYIYVNLEKFETSQDRGRIFLQCQLRKLTPGKERISVCCEMWKLILLQKWSLLISLNSKRFGIYWSRPLASPPPGDRGAKTLDPAATVPSHRLLPPVAPRGGRRTSPCSAGERGGGELAHLARTRVAGGTCPILASSAGAAGALFSA
jgi:hypothetical protein